MTRHVYYLAAVIFAICFFIANARALAECDDLQQMVHTYLDAYIRQDLSVVRAHSPSTQSELFGAFPFTSFPTLSEPKVDRNQALVEFTGEPREKELPKHGGLLFYRDMKDHYIWKLRQVLFFDKIPAIFNLPTRSKSDADRGYEPLIASLARRCLQAWQLGDTDTLLAHWHNWTTREGVPIRGLSVRDFNVVIMPTNHKEQFAHYKARLTYQWGLLSYSMSIGGGLFLTKDASKEWRVRGNVMAFYF